MTGRFSNKSVLQALASELQPELAFPLSHPEEWEQWRVALRTRLAALLGGIPDYAGVPEVEQLERRELDGVTRQKLALRGRDGVIGLAYLLTPSGTEESGTARPAVLCLHGHGRGMNDVVGEPGGGSPQEQAAIGEHISAHNYDYALQLARRGYVTLAPEARGFGERADRGGDESDCYVPGVISLMLGRPITGQRLSDDLSALDYLSALPFVDAQRIGCAGLSEGGKRTLYLSALDERLKAVVISGYFSTLKGAIQEWHRLASWDICNYVPGLLRYADYPDLAALIAPRPLLIEYATDDPLYELTAVEEAIETTAKAYDVLGAADGFAADRFTGGHRWNGLRALPWLDRWLGL